ncbi:MAG: S41 family peptidase [Syntrophobacterales bacterium]|nr:S41 family peptidase [Syntrophobacterales bacterium]
MKRTFLRKRNLLFLLPAVFILWLLSGSNGTNSAFAVNQNIYKNLKLFNEALNLIEKNYVEEIDPKTVIGGAIKGMTMTLDPHSVYMTADIYKEMQVDTKGVFGGLGIVITIQDHILTVVSPIEDTPAYLAGIKAQDRIIAIEGKSTKGFTILDAVHKLRGPKGTKVTITIMRKGLAKPKDFTITRNIIKIKSVKYNIVENHIGYIRITQFQESTADEVKKALKEINTKENSLNGLILDLRNNPGGLMNQAVKVSDIFLKTGTIVSTKGRIKTAAHTYSAHNNGDEPTCPIITMINMGSASASEIVAGALRDNGRAILLGTRTFGKGSVQVVIPLNDGSALKLTTAKYYTPSGHSIQARGIDPDIFVERVKQNNNSKLNQFTISEKDLKRHLKEEEVKTKEEEKKLPLVEDDNQLKRAIDLLKSWNMFKQMGNG